METGEIGGTWESGESRSPGLFRLPSHPFLSCLLRFPCFQCPLVDYIAINVTLATKGFGKSLTEQPMRKNTESKK